jgi:hypothetical protein
MTSFFFLSERIFFQLRKKTKNTHEEKEKKYENLIILSEIHLIDSDFFLIAPLFIYKH